MKTYQKDKAHMLLAQAFYYYVEVSSNLYQVKKNRHQAYNQGHFVTGNEIAKILNTSRRVVIERVGGTLVSTFNLDENVGDGGFEL